MSVPSKFVLFECANTDYLIRDVENEKFLNRYEEVELLNTFALTIDKLDEDNTVLRKENEDLKFALRAEQALNRVHNSSQPFRI